MRSLDLLAMVKYAKEHKLSNTKGWKWVKYVDADTKKILKYLRVSINNMKSKNRKWHFGYPIPKNVQDAYSIDAENGNTMWADSIKKELDELRLYDCFTILPRGESAPPDYQYVPMHLVFDVKFDGRHKSRYVVNGNVTRDMNPEDVYAPVISLDFIRILFLIAVMNNLDVRMVDISCAFLQSKTKEKLYTRAGIEWGEEIAGRVLILAKSVYGTKTAAQACLLKR